jgi:hypothetical protein
MADLAVALRAVIAVILLLLIQAAVVVGGVLRAAQAVPGVLAL